MLRSIVFAALLASASAPAFAEQLPPGLEALRQSCMGRVDSLPIVRRETVAAIGPGTRVVIYPLCNGLSLTTFGNAAGLSRTIRTNPTLAAALKHFGWRGDDVIGIVVNDGQVVLYVHRD